MATTRITDLPSLSILTDDDIFLVTDGLASTNAMTYADLKANVTTAVEGSTLTFTSDVTFAGSVSGVSIDALSDVIVTAPTAGQYLTYDGTKWVNDTFAFSSYSISSLNDVHITGANDGQVLAWNQSNGYWTPTTLSDVSVSSVFGRTGDVVATIGDYSTVQITNDSNLSGASLRDALNTLTSAIHSGDNISTLVNNTGFITDVNLSYDAGTRTVINSAGDNVALPLAVSSGNAGLLSGSDKAKLDALDANAEENVNADWTATTGDAQILNKPTLGSAAAADSADFATAAQGTKADTALQPSDNISALNNDAGYLTSADTSTTDLSYDASTRVLSSSNGNDATLPEVVAGGNSGLMTGADKTKLDSITVSSVDSVNGQSGAVTIDADDIDDTSTTNKFATAAQLSKIDGVAAGAEVNVNADWNAVSGDAQILNKPTIPTTTGELTNNAGFITAAEADVQSVNSQTGDVVLDADDISDTSTTNKFATAAQLNKLDGIEVGATADQSGLEIKTLYEIQANTNAFTDAEKTKLSGISAGAEVNTVDSVAGKTGAVSLVKGDVGLGNVDNTSDANKPVSSAAQTALNAKADLIGGVIPSSQIPSVAITEYLGSVASQAALTALSGETGDWAIRTDTSSTWVITANDGSTFSDWVELAHPTGSGPVSDVNGQSGSVILDADDIDDSATTHKFATAAQLSAADSALQPGDLNPVLFSDQASLPSASSNHGAIAHSHADGAMYFAHAGSWIELANATNIPTSISQLSNDSGFITSADGGNAATLDGIDSTQFLRSDQADAMTGDLTVNGDIVIGDDAADALAGPELSLKRNSASPDDGDYLGQIRFDGKNDNGGDQLYAKITGKTSDVSLGTEDGLIEIAVVKDGTQTIVSRQTGDALKLINGTGLEVNGNITVDGTVDGRDVAADGTKLDGIEAGATAGPGTDADVKTAYENNPDTNAFTDAEKTKLSGIATGAEVNVNADWNAVSGDAEILNKPTIPTATSDLTNDSGFITSADGGNADQLDGQEGSYYLDYNNFTNTPAAGGATQLSELSDVTINGNSTSDSNLGIGNATYNWNSDGDKNVCIGLGAGDSNSGDSNVVIGYNAGTSRTNSPSNILIGDSAGYRGGSLFGNDIAIGKQALFGHSTYSGYNNVAIGASACGGTGTTTATNNVCVGKSAASNLTTGSDNVVVGVETAGSLTTGGQNVLIGPSAGHSLTDGLSNVIIGNTGGRDLTSGNYNVIIGREAGRHLNDTDYGIAIGYQAAYNMGEITDSIIIGRDNHPNNHGGGDLTGANRTTAIGTECLYNLQFNQADNTYFGYRAGYGQQGQANTCIGSGAGDTTNTGDKNIIIGHDADASSGAVSNEITIGSDTETKLRFPGLQVGANNGDVLTYNSSTGYLELSAAGGGGMTDAEVKTAYENNADTNAFTDADHTKLDGIAANATNVTNNNQLTNGAGYLTSSTASTTYVPLDISTLSTLP